MEFEAPPGRLRGAGPEGLARAGGKPYARAMDWLIDVKLYIQEYSGLERDALHIHLAILLYIVALAVFRQTRRSRIPWLFVLGIEIANEISDLVLHSGGGNIAWHESLKDLWNTMLWPTVLLFVGRYTDLFQHKPHHKAEPDG